jgi:hypothetical protein
MKTILIDCDGVLVSWNNGFHAWMTDRGFVLKNDSSYHINERYGIPRELSRKLVAQFNESWQITHLEPMPGAVEAIRNLHFKHGYEFIVISSLSDSLMAGVYRRENLYTAFGVEPWREIICLPCGAEKDETLARFAKGLFWIEDKPENAEVGKKLGLRSLLFNAPYNADFKTDVPRFDTWNQIYEHILTHDSGQS